MAHYPPPHHTETDEGKLFAAIDAIRHATLIVPSDEGMQIAFTPFLLDRAQRKLVGHIARRNPQSGLFDGRRVDVVFHGPHAYISPKLNNNDDVPTWNYVNVHVTGPAQRIDDDAARWRFMEQLVAAMEGANTAGYLAFYGETLRRKMPGISVFEVGIDKLQGRFKLGRNDAPELQRQTFKALREETPPSLQPWLETLAPE